MIMHKSCRCCFYMFRYYKSCIGQQQQEQQAFVFYVPKLLSTIIHDLTYFLLSQIRRKRNNQLLSFLFISDLQCV